MQVKTITSAVLLALSGAAIAQVTTAPNPKLGNAPDAANAQVANVAGPADNAADNRAADNRSDPGKP